MKKLLTITFFCILLSVPALGQNRTRVFDNFDTRSGVQVVSPTVAPINTPAKTKKGKTKATVINISQNGTTVEKNGLVKRTASNNPRHLPVTMGMNPGLKGFTTGVSEYDSYIVESSQRYNIDPLLIYAQMHQESSFKLRATSYKGASGLMQLMPATARRFGVTEIYNPKQNIDAGVKYMRWLLNTFNQDVVLALAGYNAGEGAVMKYGWQVPPYRETQEYVRRITGRYASISNPLVAKTVRKVNTIQATKLEQKAAAPLTVYEPDAVAVRLPDGRMRLVNQ